ncbi:hypothetical protein [Puerhibacterium puerhi]|uniref:hypothetical protein n=1 Tax=Puerhibacterium puerhi TaxID=2692623 RepID=UPI00135A5B46|nr:hypothetical protein [Puerhibacterium puerhi]
MDTASDRPELLDTVMGYDRWGDRSRRAIAWGAGLAVAIGVAVLWGVVPALWRTLDRAPWLGAAAERGAPLDTVGDTAFVALYAAAHLAFVAPALVLAATMLVHRRRRGPRARVSTPVFVAVHALAMVQLMFLVATASDPATSHGMDDRVLDAGVSIWGADAIVRGWYVGIASLVLMIAAAGVAARVRRDRQVAVFLGLLVLALAVPWVAFGVDYLVPPRV